MDKTESIIIQKSELTIGLATPQPKVLLTPNLGVIGVGGAGGNAVNNMVKSGVTGCAFFAANTDAQVLSKSLVADKIQLGEEITKGLGAGSNPEVGRQSAEESAEKIKDSIKDLHLLFLTAGMGGGTGTGAIPVIAKYAKEMGILTVAVVSTPFKFEGNRRMEVALKGIEELQKYVDTLIIVPNQNLFRIAKPHTSLADAFKMSDDVLCQGVRSITDLVMNPGMINLDFADVRTVLTTMGRAMMGTGIASGENRAEKAADMALTNPLLDDCSIKGAKSVLVNITGGLDVGLDEVDEIMQRIVSQADENAMVKMGSAVNEGLAGSIQVSIVATGLGKAEPKPVFQQTVPSTPIVAPTVAPETITISSQTTTIQVTQTETEEKQTPPEEPNLIAPDGLGFAPVMGTEYRPNPKNLENTVSPEEVVRQSNLFDNDAPPVIQPITPVHKKTEVKTNINVENQKTISNVKQARPSLMDLIFKNSKGKSEVKQEAKTTEDFSDSNDGIPDFFRR